MELIEQHLDQALNAEERAGLVAQLTSDPDFAISFARAARLDGALEARFTEDAREADLSGLITSLQTVAPRRRILRPALFASAAAIALLLGIAIFRQGLASLGGGAPQETSTRQATETTIERPGVRLSEKPKLTAILPKRAENKADAESRIRQRLTRFYLPETNIQDLPLSEALAALQESFSSVDQLGWGKEEALTFTVLGATKKLPSVTLARTNISVLNALELIAVQSGHEVTFDPPKITLVPDTSPDKEPGEQLLARTFEIAYELLVSGPYREAVEVSASGLDNEPERDITPFLREHWGLPLARGAEEGTYDFSKERAFIITSIAESNRFAAFVREASGKSESSAKIRITTKLIEIPESFPMGADRILDAEEWISIVTQLNTEKGVSLLTAPMLSIGVNQMGTTKISSRTAPLNHSYLEPELPDAVIEQPAGDDPQMAQALGLRPGFRFPMTADVIGEQITLRGEVDQIFHEDQLGIEALTRPDGGSSAELVRFLTEFEAPLHPGQTALFECESPQTGQKTFAAITIDWNTSVKQVPQKR